MLLEGKGPIVQSYCPAVPLELTFWRCLIVHVTRLSPIRFIVPVQSKKKPWTGSQSCSVGWGGMTRCKILRNAHVICAPKNSIEADTTLPTWRTLELEWGLTAISQLHPHSPDPSEIPSLPPRNAPYSSWTQLVQECCTVGFSWHCWVSTVASVSPVETTLVQGPGVVLSRQFHVCRADASGLQQPQTTSWVAPPVNLSTATGLFMEILLTCFPWETSADCLLGTQFLNSDCPCGSQHLEVTESRGLLCQICYDESITSQRQTSLGLISCTNEVRKFFYRLQRS